MYRIMGIPEDASRERLSRTYTRLLKKYEGDEAHLQRIESAHLWITMRMLWRKEQEEMKAPATTRLSRAFAPLTRKLERYIPGSVKQLADSPDMAHLRRSTSLLGVFCLIGLLVPNMIPNVIGLAGASTMGLVYSRGRPEPVRDEMGRAGEVRKLNVKEMGASVAMVAATFAFSAVLSFGALAPLGAPPAATFHFITCSMLWVVASFGKVYEAFDS